jgi:Tol biopolymer transport system component
VYDDAATAGSWETDIYIVATDGSRDEPLVKDHFLGPIAPIGLSRTGAWYYTINTGRQELYIGEFEASTGMVLGQRPVSVRSPDFQATPSWSPDGRYLAYTLFPGRGYTQNRKVVIHAVDSGQERILHPDLTWIRDEHLLTWSPDGRSLLTNAIRGALLSLYAIDVQSGTVSGPLLPGDANVRSFEWSKDGKAIYYVDQEGNPVVSTVRSDIRVHTLETGRNEVLYRPVDSRDSRLGRLHLSPDGAWLAVGSGPSPAPPQANAVLLLPTGGGRPREVFRAESGQTLNLLGWTPEGTHLLFNRMGALWRVPADGGQPQRLGPAIPGRFHPDGKRVALAAPAEGSREVWVMENFLGEARTARDTGRRLTRNWS